MQAGHNDAGQIVGEASDRWHLENGLQGQKSACVTSVGFLAGQDVPEPEKAEDGQQEPNLLFANKGWGLLLLIETFCVQLEE